MLNTFKVLFQDDLVSAITGEILFKSGDLVRIDKACAILTEHLVLLSEEQEQFKVLHALLDKVK